MSKIDDKCKELNRWFHDYVKSFYTNDAEVQRAMLMKEEHTSYVRDVARLLALHLKFSPHDATLAEIMGVLHDVGRFRQFTVYKTFNDAQSCDHAEMGLRVMDDEQLLDGFPDDDASLIRFAIQNHNKKVIAPAPSERALLFAKLLRDADKLDIYRVLEPFIGPPDGTGVSPDFRTRFVSGEQVDYTLIRTQDDRKLVRLMWVYDVNFVWTLRRIVERGYIEKIIDNLPHGDDEIKKGIVRLRAYVEQRLKEDK